MQSSFPETHKVGEISNYCRTFDENKLGTVCSLISLEANLHLSCIDLDYNLIEWFVYIIFKFIRNTNLEMEKLEYWN